MDFLEIWGRVKEVTGWKKQLDMALFLGITGSSISGAKDRGKFPSDWAVKIAQHYGVSTDWLLSGEGQRSPELTSEDNAASATEALSDSGEFAFIPIYDVEIEAGPGALNGDERIVSRMAFRRDWLKEKTLDPSKLAVARVVGDSMTPTLSSGDMILLDLRAARARENAIYAFEVAGQIRVKRLQPLIDGSILVRSDNPSYETEMVPPAEVDRLRVIGRGVWVGKSL